MLADAGPVAPVDAQTPVDAGPRSSGGAGGLTCERRDPLADGRSICVLKVGSVELKVVEPKGGAAAAGGALALGLYLHGDGAGAHKSGSALKAMIPWIDTKRGLGVSVLAPNGCAWWQKPTHACESSLAEPDRDAENTRALAAALTALASAFDLRLDRTYYYGSSGGSIFLTEQWLPLEAGRHPGVFALMCGGEVTRRDYAWSEGASRNRFAFTYGDQDFLRPDIEATVSALKAKSFDVTEKVLPGAAHCAFDAHGEAMAVWGLAP